MNKEQNFAKALKELRKSKGLTLDHISDSSKIKKQYLERIENGDFFFKSEIYINLFLKEYIKCVDPQQTDAIMQEFSSIFNTSNLETINSELTFVPINDSDEDPKEEFELLNSTNHNPKKIASIITTVIIIIFLYQTISNYFLN